jgi:DNA-binding NarL/FixJ family response regulator
MTLTVLLVDDHPVVRSGYRRLLEQAGGIRIVAEADDAEQAYTLYCDLAPDLTLTDLSMPGAGGLELIRRLRARNAQACVLVVSMHDSQALVRRALDAGALGFVSKSAAPDGLVAAVRAVAEGQRHLGPGLAPDAPQGEAAREAQALAQLTEREFALFRLLAQGHSVAECAGILKLSTKTLSNYQTQVKDKLGVATTAAMAHLAIRHGIVSGAGN